MKHPDHFGTLVQNIFIELYRILFVQFCVEINVEKYKEIRIFRS